LPRQTKLSTQKKTFAWQYVFLYNLLSKDPPKCIPRDHPLGSSELQRAVKTIGSLVKIDKPVSPRTFRHCFATHLLEAGFDIRTVKKSIGQQEFKTTMIYTHVFNVGQRSCAAHWVIKPRANALLKGP
jgi:site-specific recombinase XerC